MQEELLDWISFVTVKQDDTDDIATVYKKNESMRGGGKNYEDNDISNTAETLEAA